jgi:hypothetical protein
MSITDRRRSLRHNLAFDVSLRVGVGGEEVRGKAIDVSRSGIFVVTRDRVPEGRRVDITITGPLVGPPVVTSGIVVHIMPGVGIGIRFSHQHPRTRELIGELIDRVKKSA